MARPQRKAERAALRSRPKAAPRRARRYIYAFGGGKADGAAAMKDLLGGKGANLAEMARLGLPVPPGFTISTEVCTYYYAHGRTYPSGLRDAVQRAMARVEKLVGRRFGDPENPLLVSVRSGARASMPGMMDTILNLGLNDRTVQGLIRRTGSARFVYDSYRRFVKMYGEVVLELKPEGKHEENPFEVALAEKKRARGVKLDTDLDAAALRELLDEFKALIKIRKGVLFPEDPKEQLWGAIGAVFGSWMNPRAIAYRKTYDIPETWGTAVNVQSMVFGNMGPNSGTGVAFSRDPATGQNVFYGEVLMNAQGEDVVAGIRTPLPIGALAKERPQIYAQLDRIRRKLERHYRDMMDIEFTIEEGRLYMLQCRVAKRTGVAAIRIALDMVDERLIPPREALLRVDPEQLKQLLAPSFEAAEKQRAVAEGRLLARGLAAGPGAATGRIVLHPDDAVRLKAQGQKVLLVRIETSPEDFHGMKDAEGILTTRGGLTSHAALVARQMGKVCVVGCEALVVDYAKGEVRIVGRDDVALREGDDLSIDGSAGEVFQGRIRTQPSEIVRVLVDRSAAPASAPLYQLYARLMKWADGTRRLRVRANADQADQCEHAIGFGAEGVGLCRTEHMFAGHERIAAMHEMILSETPEERRAALDKLLPHQRSDFEGIFRAMNGRPITIRLIDPPLHEFLPHDEDGQRKLSARMGIALERLRERVDALREANPMLGLRGCRLGIVYPEITEMQARAIFEAAANVKRNGTPVEPEVMIPLVGHVKEFVLQADVVRRVADEVMQETDVRFRYLVGTMVEVPRGALTADEIAARADFFSFGTNDLTQMTLGVSRDDAARFLLPYVDRFEIYAKDPFESIDQRGVGGLMRLAVDTGRRANRTLKVGICGEHGGDPASIRFCHAIGLDYVSCSPFRVPIARLAAAQAALRR